MSSGSMSVSSGSSNIQFSKKDCITDDEKALYDRQIRLWGLDAQNRLRNSTALIAGLSGSGAETAKNLMLAGLKSLTLLDSKLITEHDFASNFFISNSSIGENRARASRYKCQLLNPNVKLVIDTEELAKKDDEYFRKFDLIILMDQEYSLIKKINEICRINGIRFEAAGVYGWIGYAFFDFNNHAFYVNAPKTESVDCTTLDDENYGPSQSTVTAESVPITTVDEEKIRTNLKFPSWMEAWNVAFFQKRLIRKFRMIGLELYPIIRALLRAHDQVSFESKCSIEEIWKEEYKKCFAGNELSTSIPEFIYFSEPQLSVTCAIIGGVVAQEAMKALSENGEPFRNVFLYSALGASGTVFELPPLN